MNHDVAIIVAFFLGIVADRFYDYLKCEWEVKAARKKGNYPSAKPVQRGIIITKHK